MFEQASYTHPKIEPFFSGSWTEVAFSWVIAAAVITAVLAFL
jgi:hypothetical protein